MVVIEGLKCYMAQKMGSRRVACGIFRDLVQRLSVKPSDAAASKEQ